MAPHMDNRRSSSSYCSSTTLVLFVALCLVGVWMITSSTITPLDLFSAENKSDDKEISGADGLGGDNVREADIVTEVKAEDEVESKKVDGAEKNSAKVDEDDHPELSDVAKKDDLVDKNPAMINDDRPDESADPHDIEKDEINRKSSEETLEDEQRKSIKKNVAENGSDERAKTSDNNSNENDGNGNENAVNDTGASEVATDGAQLEVLNERDSQSGTWKTQASESTSEKEVQASSSSKGQMIDYSWKLCNVAAGADYIPCLDNEKAIKKLPSTKHYQHRERHCPEEAPTCLVQLPNGYKQPIQWPFSRDKVWYKNVPHTKLVAYKGHQNWVKVSGEYLTFPGGGTQFKNGALHYIDQIQQTLPELSWGKRSRVVLDVGCGVASFGGYLFERDALTLSFAPKDEHEAQVQFALERGIPALSAVMGTKRLPFPSRVFDVIHCARCRVPWHIEGGMLLVELNRLLRPGGYFVWSATPVYRKDEEDVGIWNAMTALTKSMCWKLVAKSKDKLNLVGFAIYRKPSDNICYDKRKDKSPPLCQESDDPNAAWNVPLQACLHRLPVDPVLRGSQWPEQWPLRLEKVPYWLNNSQVGVYGKPAPEDFQVDYEHWKHVVSKSYLNGMGINWSTVRNVMDMRSLYGGFAAALRDMNVWVMNIVTVDSPDTLPIIYERGLFGMYHDWCESFSTYPRSYDLLHADHLFSKLKNRCKLLPVIAEVDRILRADGKLIVRDNAETIGEIESMAKSLHWEVKFTFSKDNEGLLCVQKTMWRPEQVESST